MRVEVAVGMAQRGQVIARSSVKCSASSPATRSQSCVERVGHAGEAPDGVEREVDRVELDVRDRMQQRGAAFGRGRRARAAPASDGTRRGTAPGGPAGPAGGSGAVGATGALRGPRRAGAVASATFAPAIGDSQRLQDARWRRLHPYNSRFWPLGEQQWRSTNSTDIAPQLADGAWVADSAQVIGQRRAGRRTPASGSARVLRGDTETLPHRPQQQRAGRQSCCTTDAGLPLTIGDNVTRRPPGHAARLHGRRRLADRHPGGGAERREDRPQLPWSAPAALVTEGKEFPDGSLIVGAPGQGGPHRWTRRRSQGCDAAPQHYVENALASREGRRRSADVRAAQVPVRRAAGARHAGAPDRRLAGSAARGAPRRRRATCRCRCAHCSARWPRPAALMQANIKFNGALILQIFGDGPVKLAVAEVQPDLSLSRHREGGRRRGGRCAPAGDWSTCNGRGRCAITLDPQGAACRASRPTRAWCRCNGDHGAGCSKPGDVLEHYMLQSEQLDTRLVLAADDAGRRRPADPAPAGRGARPT